MNRRGFLGSILAAAAAPAIVRADSLMRIVPMETTLLVGDSDLAITIDEFSRRYMRPALHDLELDWARLYGPQRLIVRRPNRYMADA